VLPDLSDLVDRIEWARAETQHIQTMGKEFAERVIADVQNDCYWFLVLLEWARLQSGQLMLEGSCACTELHSVQLRASGSRSSYRFAVRALTLNQTA
jgi:hypothetical protein